MGLLRWRVESACYIGLIHLVFPLGNKTNTTFCLIMKQYSQGFTSIVTTRILTAAEIIPNLNPIKIDFGY